VTKGSLGSSCYWSWSS